MNSQPNASQIDYWNSEATRGWSERHEPIDRLFADMTRVLLDFAAPKPGEQVLDIGCASGTTLLEIAPRVAPGGHVFGADIAARSVARARERIAAAGVTNAEAHVADASTYDFAAARFDLAFSRFGVMFFVDPVATFTHLRRALKPSGRAAFAAWRSPRDNAGFTAPRAAIAHLLPPIEPPGPEEPGQFAWANPDRIHRILDGAGFHKVTLTPHDFPLQIAAPGQPGQAIEFVLQMGPVGAAIRDATPETQAEIRATLERFFAPHVTPQGIHLPGAIWLVAARA